MKKPLIDVEINWFICPSGLDICFVLFWLYNVMRKDFGLFSLSYDEDVNGHHKTSQLIRKLDTIPRHTLKWIPPSTSRFSHGWSMKVTVHVILNQGISHYSDIYDSMEHSYPPKLGQWDISYSILGHCTKNICIRYLLTLRIYVMFWFLMSLGWIEKTLPNIK